MRALFVIILLATLLLPTLAVAEVQTFTATHTYILGDHDSKDDARQRCLLETKRKILEQAGVYIESASEVKNFDLTKDQITSFAAAVMQVKDTREEVGYQQEHMTMTLKLTAQVDLAEVRKQLAAHQVDAGVRDDVAAQRERLKRLEAQFEAMQPQTQVGQAPSRAPASPPSDVSVALHIQASQGNADAQYSLGMMYETGAGELKDYAEARQWYEKAAAQGNARAQSYLGTLYAKGQGVPQDYAVARQWYEEAAAQGYEGAQVALGMLYAKGQGVPQNSAKAIKWFEQAAAQGNGMAQLKLGILYDLGMGMPQDNVRAYMWYNLVAGRRRGDFQEFGTEKRDRVASFMTPAQIAEAQRLAQQCQAQQFKDC